MEPRIQYAKTEDGVNIAFWTMGEGPPFVMIPTVPFSHVQLEWKMPAYARWYDHFARERLLLRYDPRGSGLSQRDVSDFSLEAQLQDLAAVVDRADVPRFALWAFSTYGCAIGVTYAARFPERITRLVLFSPAPSGVLTPALDSMREENWELYLRTLSHMVMGWPEGDLAGEIGAIMAESVTPKTAAAVGDALGDLDTTPLLSDVSAPTLVVARRQSPTPLDAVTSVAARLPNARLVVLEGDSMAFLDDPQVVTAIDEFLSEGDEEEQAAAASPAPGGFATILFTDMAASTALTQQLGDAGAQEVRRAHNEIVRPALSANAGSEIKHTGDGIMASFATASSALDAAIAIQRGVAEYNVGAHGRAPLGIYIGLNAGEPIAEEGDLFGTSINLAARICDRAEAGQILAADVVRQLAAGKQFLFADLGETELRGFEDPVKLWELRWEAEGSP